MEKVIQQQFTIMILYSIMQLLNTMNDHSACIVFTYSVLHELIEDLLLPPLPGSGSLPGRQQQWSS